MDHLTKRYGLFTATCMVVGTCIGSGIFFKAQNVLIATGGNMPLGIAAWVITGLLTIVCALQFAVMSSRYQDVGGVLDYAEATCGKTYGYYMAWFMVNMYYPGMTSVLAWVSARYTGVLFGWQLDSAQVMTLAGFFLVACYSWNALSPRLAGRLQVSSTVIKMVPICLMAVVGTLVGLSSGTLTANFTTVVYEVTGTGGGLFAAISAVVFAYEGWIVATSINEEIENPKRNLPLALVLGSLIVVAAYVLYYIGVAGGATNEVLMREGATVAFSNVFGKVGGACLNVCIVISCLGTLNGLMVGATRGMYAIAVRGEGPRPRMFSQVDASTNMVTNSAIWGLLVCSAWLLYYYGANLTASWFGLFSFDSSELPVLSIYALYIPMFVMWMVKEKDLDVLRRFVLPVLAILACGFMVFCGVSAHGIRPWLAARARGEFAFPVLFYMIVFAVVMAVGALVRRPRSLPSAEAAGDRTEPALNCSEV